MGSASNFAFLGVHDRRLEVLGGLAEGEQVVIGEAGDDEAATAPNQRRMSPGGMMRMR